MPNTNWVLTTHFRGWRPWDGSDECSWFPPQLTCYISKGSLESTGCSFPEQHWPRVGALSEASMSYRHPFPLCTAHSPAVLGRRQNSWRSLLQHIQCLTLWAASGRMAATSHTKPLPQHLLTFASNYFTKTPCAGPACTMHTDGKNHRFSKAPRLEFQDSTIRAEQCS